MNRYLKDPLSILDTQRRWRLNSFISLRHYGTLQWVLTLHSSPRPHLLSFDFVVLLPKGVEFASPTLVSGLPTSAAELMTIMPTEKSLSLGIHRWAWFHLERMRGSFQTVLGLVYRTTQREIIIPFQLTYFKWLLTVHFKIRKLSTYSSSLWKMNKRKHIIKCIMNYFKYV